MVQRNPHIASLHGNYLFPEIEKRRKDFLQHTPHAKLISLGIGDTTEPLSYTAARAIEEKGKAMATCLGYSGYGPTQGLTALRHAISQRFYGNAISPDELFISDGAKCDIGRLQLLFGPEAVAAVQDPAYPVYVDSAVAIGQGGAWDEQQRGYRKIVYLPCTPENNFFPDLHQLAGYNIDLLYICSPNNPTGMVATSYQLEQLVAFARSKGSIIVFDAAYAPFIRDPSLPRSIYEIEGAREVAIEIGSFSKWGGFTGVRLGWSVVPEELCYSDGTPLQHDWQRLLATLFNGASILAQCAGLALLTEEGWRDIHLLTEHYLANAAVLRQAIASTGHSGYGGENIPYLWVPFAGLRSWEIFTRLLEEAHLLVTPGSGFGPTGEGFIRLSAFGEQGAIAEAATRLSNFLRNRLPEPSKLS